MTKPKRGRDSVVFAVGKRGSGKSSWLKQYARGFGRVLVWDPKNEYANALGVSVIRSTSDLYARIFEPVIVFVPPKGVGFKSLLKIFDFVCECVALYRPGSLFLVDELGRVSKSWGGSGWWNYLECEGRHDSISLAAANQRPVGIDPDFVSNATRLVIFRLGKAPDRKLMAEELDLDESVLRIQRLCFLDFDVESERITRSRIVFS